MGKFKMLNNLGKQLIYNGKVLFLFSFML